MSGILMATAPTIWVAMDTWTTNVNCSKMAAGHVAIQKIWTCSKFTTNVAMQPATTNVG